MEQNKPKPTRGGARPGAGRPKGSQERVTIGSLLESFEQASGGERYEDVLWADFYEARNSGDRVMAHKYHNLILNKLAPTLLHTEVNETTTVENRQQAFLKALETIGTVAQTLDNDSKNGE